MEEGRFFSEERKDDCKFNILNEAAAKLCNYVDGPIG